MIKHRNHLTAAITCIVVFLGHAAFGDLYDPPANYYEDATGTGATLKSQLRTIMTTGHILRTYGDFRFSAAIHDADPNNPGNILTVYNRQSVNAAWDSGATWDREHLWPDSRQPGNASNGAMGNIADPHALRPCIPSINQSRGNKAFGFETNSGPYGSVNANYYFPGDFDKGDVARQIFYSDVRWTSDGLSLTDSVPSGFQMGDLSSLIAWHFQDVPDDFERHRNHSIYSSALNPSYYTNNRSAFVDRPEYVWSVYVDQSNDSGITIAGGTTDANNASTRDVSLGRVFVNGALPAAQSFTLNKSGLDGTYFEVTTSGLATSSINGRFNAFRTDQTDSKSITVGLNADTVTSGLKTGTVTVNNLDVTTMGGAGSGANDGDDTFNVSLAVLDHPIASFSPSENLRERVLDFGIVPIGASIQSLGTSLLNFAGVGAPAFAADLDLDGILGTGDTGVFQVDVAPFSGLEQGNFIDFDSLFTPTSVGQFSAEYTLNLSDEDLPGALAQTLTLTLLAQTILAGDYNRDGVVDMADYVVWSKSDGQAVADYEGADGDGSGEINADDLLVWQHNFGMVAPGGGGTSAHVPEPASFVLAIVGFAAICARSRCRYR